MPVAGLALFYAYVWLRVDPGLLYYWTRHGLPGFTMGFRHARPFLARPGGPVEYASAFLFQLYCFSWAGALVMTLVGGGICLSLHSLMRAFGGGRSSAWAAAPALPLLLMHGRYAYILPQALAVLIALAAACVYVRVRRLRAPGRFVAFAVLLALTHYLAGGAVFLLAVVCALAELLVRGRRSLAAGMAALAGGLPALAALGVYNIRFRDAYARLLPFHPATDERAWATLAGLYVFLVLAVCLTNLLRRPRAERVLARIRGPALARAAVAGLLAAAAAVAVWAGFDSQVNAYLTISRACRRDEWQEAVRAGRRVQWRADSLAAALNVNRALYHCGRLTEDMFSFPQNRSGLLMPPAEMVDLGGDSAGVLMTFSDILTDLGRVNLAEHFAHETFSRVGDRPWVLERLALVQIVKGEIAAGSVFLHALGGNPGHGGRARRLLRALAADPTLSGDAELQRLRSVMPDRDDVNEPTVELLLTQLLERNPQNRMAFEYLMAHYMLTLRTGKVYAGLSWLDGLGYEVIPRHIEEAILIHGGQGDTRLELGGRRIRPETSRRFGEFMRVLHEGYGVDRKGTYQALERDFGDTYFFYYNFAPDDAATGGGA